MARDLMARVRLRHPSVLESLPRASANAGVQHLGLARFLLQTPLLGVVRKVQVQVLLREVLLMMMAVLPNETIHTLRLSLPKSEWV